MHMEKDLEGRFKGGVGVRRRRKKETLIEWSIVKE